MYILVKHIHMHMNFEFIILFMSNTDALPFILCYLMSANGLKSPLLVRGNNRAY